MRILVYEFVSGGGLAGRPVPESLAREGLAMATALVADLAALRAHRIVITEDRRFPLPAPRGVEVVTMPPRTEERGALLHELVRSADAVWLVAPERDRCLESLAARVERQGRPLLGPGAAAIRRASDKASLARRLSRCGVPHPNTRVVSRGPRVNGAVSRWKTAAREIGYPLVVKPRRGADCEGVCLVRSARELGDAVDVAGRTEKARRGKRRESVLLQRYVPGVAASVSLLANGRGAVALAVNAQLVRASRRFSYRGGRTPFDHPLAQRAVEAAQQACRALPGLRGYIGVDLVLTTSEAVVIEVNPRLTTAYLGIRSAFDCNVAALALAACAGALPAPPTARRCVRFTAEGRIVSAN